MTATTTEVGTTSRTASRPSRCTGRTGCNAFTLTMADELAAVAAAADADDDVRVVVVTGAGRAFCAGADLGGGPRHVRRPARPGASAGPLSRTIGGVPRDAGGVASLPFAALRKPVIAAVNGPAVGIGATLTLPMDIRIAAESAPLRVRLRPASASCPEAASSWFLPRVVGISQAMEWVATGRVFDAAEALRGRLVSRVRPGRRAAAHRVRAGRARSSPTPAAPPSARPGSCSGRCSGRPRRGTPTAPSRGRWSSSATGPTPRRAWPRSWRSGRRRSPPRSRTSCRAWPLPPDDVVPSS